MINAQVKEKKKDIFDIARSGSVEEVKALMAIHSDTINAVNSMGFTPLILACYKGNTDVAKFLIGNVTSIDHNSTNGTALAATIVKGNVFLAKILLENNANPNKADANGVTPLIYAIQFKNKELIQLLLQFKADTLLADATGKKPFEYAVFTKDQDIINLLKN
jgi:ankyrin repeat protein